MKWMALPKERIFPPCPSLRIRAEPGPVIAPTSKIGTEGIAPIVCSMQHLSCSKRKQKKANVVHDI